jgi:hypothetical protein
LIPGAALDSAHPDVNASPQYGKAAQVCARHPQDKQMRLCGGAMDLFSKEALKERFALWVKLQFAELRNAYETAPVAMILISSSQDRKAKAPEVGVVHRNASVGCTIPVAA